MKGHLYFICPADYLEPIIDSMFENDNYYYTSLGNSVIFDPDVMPEIAELIIKHDIREISLVLSCSNPIIMDALEHQNFVDLRGLNHIYSEIPRQKKNSEVLSKDADSQFMVLSYYLNAKIKELKEELARLDFTPLQINGKIYFGEDKIFREIYSDLVCTDLFGLN